MKRKTSKRGRKGLMVLAMAAAGGAPWSAILTPPAQATTVITNPFRGVTLYQRTEASGAVVPRPVVMNILEIDLTDPTISMVITPSNGADPGDVNGQTTRQFVTSMGAQIGVNGNLWSPVGTGPN